MQRAFKDREMLLKRLDANELTINQLIVDSGQSISRKPRMKTKAKTKVKAKGNHKLTLSERLIDILSSATQPMSTRDIFDAAIKAGWKSKSKNKLNVICQTLNTMTTTKSIKTATKMNNWVLAD